VLDIQGADCGAPGVIAVGSFVFRSVPLELPCFVVTWWEVCENTFLLRLILAEMVKGISGMGVQVECGQRFGSRHMHVW